MADNDTNNEEGNMSMNYSEEDVSSSSHEPLHNHDTSSDNNNEALLPRKRSQSSKSPLDTNKESGTSILSNTNDEEIEAVLAAGRESSSSSSIDEPAKKREDLRSTPYEMKQTNISQLLQQQQQQHDIDTNNDNNEQEEEDVGIQQAATAGLSHSFSHPSLEVLEGNLVEARGSLNASFDAALQQQQQQQATHNSTAGAASSSMNNNPIYTSPKRRKQSIDLDEEEEKVAEAASLPQQQKKPHPSSFTPLRPPNTVQKQRNRRKTGDGILFSPKPVYSDRKKNNARPPRPSSGSGSNGNANILAAGESVVNNNMQQQPSGPSSPLTPSPKYGEAQSNLHSPGGTPYRFKDFPASLPKVNHRESRDNVDERKQQPPGTAQKLNLLPKPTPRKQQDYEKMVNPQSSRRLFMQQQSGKKPPSASSLTNNPSFDNSEKGGSDSKDYGGGNQADISGDWSEMMSSTDKSVTNQQIRLSNVPSHVFQNHQQQVRSTTNNDNNTELEETIEEEEDDTVVMDEGEDDAFGNIEVAADTGFSGTKLTFSSPDPSPLDPSMSRGVAAVEERKNPPQHELLETALHPHTPRGLAASAIHNLSPINRLPEDGDDHDMADHDDTDVYDTGEEEATSCTRGGSTQPPLFSHAASPILRQSINEGVADTSVNSSASIFSAGQNMSAVNTTTSTANVNNTTLNNSNLSGLSRPTARKLRRPKPDTSAFSMGTPSQQSIGSKDSGFYSHQTGDASTDNNRLLCPPTPVRTPAWAHHASVERSHQQVGGMKRQNSLIATKVLAAAPPRVVNNLSSLEDSMLENDISESMDTTASGRGSSGRVAGFSSIDEGNAEEVISSALKQGKRAASLAKTPGTAYKGRKSTTPLVNEEINFSDFENLGILGSGAFADVYKVKSKKDGRLYAIKRNRRQFRGVKDRERAMAEVNTMKRLQTALLSEAAASPTETGSHQKDNSDGDYHSKSKYGLYLLFFIRAWQQEGFFYCQTELCSRATARHLRMSIVSEWERDMSRYPSLQSCLLDEQTGASSDIQDRFIPEKTIWQMCHDISRGLYHIHSYGMVHYDIKPSNIFFVYNSKWGTICKIGDFGLAGDIGTKDDGQEGDTAYMANELLSAGSAKHSSADIFSLGLTLYELASSQAWSLPREGDRWHEIRSGTHRPELHPSRSESLVKLIQAMIQPSVKERPTAEDISGSDEVKRANARNDSFLSQYVNDVEIFDSKREKELASAEAEARRR